MRRHTTEAIVGAITGTLTRPQLLVLGRHDDTGRLRAVGRTVALCPDQARQVAGYLTAADPGHPWTGVRFAAAWGSRDVLDAVLVRPDLVAEISADRSIDRGGVSRHQLRFQRLRLDVTAEDVPRFGQARLRRLVERRTLLPVSSLAGHEDPGFLHTRCRGPAPGRRSSLSRRRPRR